MSNKEFYRDRRRFLKTLSSVGITAAFAGNASAMLAKAKQEKTNVILIMADDFGYECVGANGGSSYKTPRIDNLAAEGTRFEHCYAQPKCTPSRVQLMTGMYNVKNYTTFGQLHESQTTFGNLFKENGYQTCIVGKWQLGGTLETPHHFGFDDYCLWSLTQWRQREDKTDNRYTNPVLEVNGEIQDLTNGEFGPDLVSDFALNFIQNHKNDPFLLYYPMILTHCPFVMTPHSADWDPKQGGSPTYKGDAKYFPDMVEYTDYLIGRLLDKLDNLGIRENTLVIFTGDNGTDSPVVSKLGDEYIAGHKGKMTDGGTRVPLIARWPGIIPSGKVCQDLVDFSDFLPTVCDSAGISVPEELAIDGKNFIPVIKGRKQGRQWIYAWYSPYGDTEKVKAFARTQRYKLYNTGEFYDVPNDRLEEHDLAEEKLTEEQLSAKKLLQGVLDSYRDQRYVALPADYVPESPKSRKRKSKIKKGKEKNVV